MTYNGENILAVIPARSGSKRLPGKNVAEIAGHPLISYSVAAALESRLVDRVICSTDSAHIADIASAYGADVPFLRPGEIAQDLSSDLDVFQHCLNWLKNNEGYQADIVLHLRPTYPIRFQGQIDRVISLLCENSPLDSVRSISRPIITPYKMWRKGDDGILTPLLRVDVIDEPYNMPSQMLPDVWMHTGTYDAVRASVIIGQNSMTGRKIFGYEIDPQYAVDIDTKGEFDLCAQLIGQVNCIKPERRL